MYPILIWNFLPPSAGSIVHPHVQILIETSPIAGLRIMLEREKEFFRENKVTFWERLIEEEKKRNERFILQRRYLSVLTSFAPRGYREILIVFHNISSFLQLKDPHILELEDTICKILKAYHNMGVRSFNLVTYSDSLTKESSFHHLIIKIISRPTPLPYYTNDTGPFERLYDTWVIDTVPEEIADVIRNYF